MNELYSFLRDPGGSRKSKKGTGEKGTIHQALSPADQREIIFHSDLDSRFMINTLSNKGRSSYGPTVIVMNPIRQFQKLTKKKKGFTILKTELKMT